MGWLVYEVRVRAAVLGEDLGETIGGLDEIVDLGAGHATTTGVGVVSRWIVLRDVRGGVWTKLGSWGAGVVLWSSLGPIDDAGEDTVARLGRLKEMVPSRMRCS